MLYGMVGNQGGGHGGGFQRFVFGVLTDFDGSRGLHNMSQLDVAPANYDLRVPSISEFP